VTLSGILMLKGYRRRTLAMTAPLAVVLGVVCQLSCDSSDRLPGEGPSGSAERLLSLVNNLRKAPTRVCGSVSIDGARSALGWAGKLACAAERQCQDMAGRGYFAHESPGHGTPTSRARDCGFRGNVAENIAWGQKYPVDVVEAWVRSPGHCRNLFEGRATVAGIATCATGAGRPLWVMLVGDETANGVD
jgi:uncharacterized protein YkwD